MASSPAHILVVDDELSVRDSLCSWFRKEGHQPTAAENANQALSILQGSSFEVVLLDIKMPGMDGLELQEIIHTKEPDTAVIMITAYASVDTAVRALKQGAFDYVTKPVDPDELTHLVNRALEQRRLRRQNVQLKEAIDELTGVESIVGESPPMRKVMELIRNVAPTDATVLIRGESGTGKELVARAIHANSGRRYFPIVPVNCGALAESLLESELFGHEKGAFTGAQYRRKGKLEMADEGTLFLDEIGTISSKTQIDLLRVLESHEFTRVGGNRSIKTDFRLISATNEDLEQLIEDGRFREDLFYRLNVFTIDVPALRERRDDIPLLAGHFLVRLTRQMDKHIEEISEAALSRLVNHDWPGNVRELANAIERAVVVGKPPAIRPEDLPFAAPRPTRNDDGLTLSDVEKGHIKRTLERQGWNISRSAGVLGVDRATLYNKIRKYGLKKPDDECAG